MAMASQIVCLDEKVADLKNNVRHFDEAGNGEDCDTDQRNPDGLEHGAMCIEGLECMDHDGHKMCMESHGSGSSITRGFSIIVLITLSITLCLH